MGAVALSAWLRLFAWLWDVDWFSKVGSQADEIREDDLNNHVKRDLGIMDGRDRIGPEHVRQSDELREALLRQPRPL